MSHLIRLSLLVSVAWAFSACATDEVIPVKEVIIKPKPRVIYVKPKPKPDVPENTVFQKGGTAE